MSSSFLEIIELPSGEIVLKRSDEDGSEPLVNIRFSDESKAYMGDAGLDVAKVMIQAGIQAAAHITEETLEDDAIVEEEITHTLH
ncbi:hypothetical protein [Oceanicoccus sp. KOV_DT_Chl]|uniref:hypothetical protein n=1 Tax=Oceanicoccus sp. KOV_DT_Chl TaxID=1904639 RepID=UPI000C7A5D39|nr:hypothetical protein [Oceanicoccus sp. KOV_DT_Chl]